MRIGFGRIWFGSLFYILLHVGCLCISYLSMKLLL